MRQVFGYIWNIFSMANGIFSLIYLNVYKHHENEWDAAKMTGITLIHAHHQFYQELNSLCLLNALLGNKWINIFQNPKLFSLH